MKIRVRIIVDCGMVLLLPLLMEPIGMRTRMKAGLRVICLNNEEKD